MRGTISILRSPLRLLGLFAICALVVPTASAHKFHTSFAEADYNEPEHSLQITLRTFPDDLTTILTRRAGRPITLDDKKQADSLTFAYLQEVFELKDARARNIKLTWVGMEASVDNAWLYFEAKLPDGLNGVQLRDRWLADLYEDQLNLVNLRDGERKLALTFDRTAGFQSITAR